MVAIADVYTNRKAMREQLLRIDENVMLKEYSQYTLAEYMMCSLQSSN